MVEGQARHISDGESARHIADPAVAAAAHLAPHLGARRRQIAPPGSSKAHVDASSGAV
jgi:hypothetical protein